MKCEICSEVGIAKNLCKKHYDRLRRTGNPETPDKNRQQWDCDAVRKRMFHNAKRRARQSGIEFTITAEHILIPEKCPALGIDLVVGDGVLQDASPSLDRIDSNRGYIPGNVAVISLRANRIKNDSTVVELEKILNYVKRLV